MAGPFRPKFADLVRNFTTTSGTGNIALGAAVAGHASLAGAVAVGERFFYCMQGIDKPAEREVGRGTMTANGTVAREPIGGATNFSNGTKTIALVVAAEWFDDIASWINGGAESLSALATSDKSSLVAAVNEVAGSAGSGGGGGATLTFAGAAGAAIPASATAVDTTGYAGAGAGAARYVYDAAVNAAFVTANPRTSFLSAGGRGFRLDPGQRLTIEMFGGKGDWNGASGTDNLAALNAAIGYFATPSYAGIWESAQPLRLGAGSYYFSARVELHKRVTIVGAGTGHDLGGNAGPTSWVFPKAQGAIIFQDRTTSGRAGYTAGAELGSSRGSVIEGISFVGTGSSSDLTAHCIQWRTTASVRNCRYYNVAGNAEHIVAYTDGSAGQPFGDANSWVSENNKVHDCGGSGQYIRGSDVNAGRSVGFSTAVCGGCGIYCRSYFANFFAPGDIAGYGNGGVYHLGNIYQLVSDNGDGGTVTPGTNDNVWHLLYAASASAQFPQWASGGSYRLMVPIYDSGSQSVFVSPYVETGTVASVIVPPSYSIGGTLTVIGGSLAVDPAYSPALSSQTGIGTVRRWGAGSSERGSYGLYSYELAGVRNPATSEFYNRETRDYATGGDGSWKESFSQGNYLRYYGDTNSVIEWHSGSSAYAGSDTKGYFGTSARQAHVRALPRLALGGGSYYTEHRIVQMLDAAPTGGAHARGEFVFNLNPSATGTLGWSCTAGGSPGTWTAVPVAAPASGGGGAAFTGSYTGNTNFTGDMNVTGQFYASSGSLHTFVYANAGDGSGYVKAQSDSALLPLHLSGSVVRLLANYGVVAEASTAHFNLSAGMVFKINGTQVVGARGAAVADATDAASAVTQLNALLARCRAHGLIA